MVPQTTREIIHLFYKAFPLEKGKHFCLSLYFMRKLQWSHGVLSHEQQRMKTFLLEPQRLGNVVYGTTEAHFPPYKWSSRCGVVDGELLAIQEDGQHFQNFYVGSKGTLYAPNSRIKLHF